MAAANCPSCGRQLEVEDAYRDWTVRCPHCGAEFVPSEADRPARAERANPAGRRRRRAERDDWDDEDDRDYDLPGRERALRQVAAPALWMEILGWGGAVVTVGSCALLILAGLEERNNNAARGGGDDGVGLLFAGGCVAVFGLPYSLAVAWGARHMRNLTSHGWAMASAILCVALFSLFGLCGVLHAGIGAWALVTLDKPVVRRAFGLRVRRRDRDWDD